MKKPLPKIKPCPAGHKAVMDHAMYNGRPDGPFLVMCRIYKCWSGPKRFTARAAIQAWNRRVK